MVFFSASISFRHWQKRKIKIAHLNLKFKASFFFWLLHVRANTKTMSWKCHEVEKRNRRFFCMMQNKTHHGPWAGIYFRYISTRLLFHMFYYDPVPLHLIICLNYGLMTISNNQGIYAETEKDERKKKKKIRSIKFRHILRNGFCFFGALFRNISHK